MARLALVLFTCLCLLHFSTSAPFTKNSFVVSSRDSLAQYYLQEYSINGTKLQQIYLPTPGACTTCRFGLDATGLLLAINMYSSDATQYHTLVHLYNSQGDLVETTDIPTGSEFVGDATVGNQEIWLTYRSGIMYTKRGTAAVVNSNIASPTVYNAAQLQLIGSKLYAQIGQLYAMDPVATTGTGTFVSLNSVSPLSATCYYIYGNAIYRYDSGYLFKHTFDAQGAVSGMSDYYLQIQTNNAAPTSLYAMASEGVTYVLMVLINGFAKEYTLVRFTDTGTQLTNQVTLDSSTTYFMQGVGSSPKITCSDGFKNQDESDIDCGGATCGSCSLGKACAVNSDCSTDYCNSTKICDTPTCSDVVKNQNETDLDCGGPNCSPCANGKSCDLHTDCSSGYCSSSNTCADPTCNDSAKNQDETDVDCGGPTCLPCEIGKACLLPRDCLGGYCNSTQICDAPTCDDGVKDQDETDVDCGGVTCPGCAIDQVCVLDGDCISKRCDAGYCVVSCFDGFMNQDETDIDCGGFACVECEIGKACSLDSDCSSNACSNNTCVNPPSAGPESSPVADQPSNTPSSNTPVGSRTPRGTLLSSAAFLVMSATVVCCGFVVLLM